MSKTLQDVVDKWHQGRSAHYSGVRVSTDGVRLWSYRTQIAWAGVGLYCIDATSYSVSTSRHQRLAIEAASDEALHYWGRESYKGRGWTCRTSLFREDVNLLRENAADTAIFQAMLPAGIANKYFSVAAVKQRGDAYLFYIQANAVPHPSPWLGNVLSPGRGIIGQTPDCPSSVADLIRDWVPEALYPARNEGRLFSYEGLLFEELEPKRGTFSRTKNGPVYVGETTTGRPVTALDVSVEDPSVFYGRIQMGNEQALRLPGNKWWRAHRSAYHPTIQGG